MRSSKATSVPRQSIDAERGDHVGRVGEILGLQDRQQTHRQHGLGSVDQRNRLFGFEHQRLDVGQLHRFRAG